MKAVILAAGLGIRLRPITNTTPKPLLKIGEKTLIEHSLDNLEKAGISEVIIVTGYLEDLIKKKLGTLYQGINISYISNKEYSNTGTMYSLSKAEEMIIEDMLFLEADLLYEPKALKLLLDSPEPDLMLAVPARGSGDDVLICTDKSGKIIDIGKEVKYKACGEWTSLAKLSLSFLKKLFEEARKDYHENKMNYYCEEIILRLSKTNPIKCLVANDLIWTEVDTEDDLRRAKEAISPKIKY